MKKILLTLGLILTISNAETITTTDYVKVQRSKPYYKTVIRRDPYQECWDERVPVRRNSYNDDPPIGAIIGGVAGGILGHQIGGGSGKTAATVGGAIIGTLVGNNLSNNNYQEYTTYETRRRCTTHYKESRRRKLVGYKNVGFYKGRKIIKISKRRLDYIPVTLKIIY